MNPSSTPSPLKALLAALLLATAGAAVASGSASSASSAGSSASMGSSSTSIEKSSESSSGKDQVAEGPYRIIEVAEAPGRGAGTVRLKLAAVATGGDEFFLYLPQAAYDASRLGQGDIVQARQRDYGLEFARADSVRPFFLVLDDLWQRELRTRPVQV